MGVAQNIGRTGLEDEDFGRVDVELFEDFGHHLLAQFGGLVGVGERGAVDDLIGPQRSGEQGGRIGFECGELAPVVPVLRLEAPLDPHGGDVAIGAAVGAVARGGE